MMSWTYLIMTVFFIWSSTGYGAEIGREACNCRPAIIRIPEMTVPTSENNVAALKYAPVKNICSCERTRLTPAMIARMQYEPYMNPTTDCDENSAEPRSYGERGGAFFQSNDCNDVGGALSGGYPVLQEPPGQDGIDEPLSCGGSGPTTAIVDPVSLMLAQAEANRCRGNGVREDRLAFGPITVPKDALPPSTGGPDINEEGLYALEKTILELKTCKRFGQKSNALATDTDAMLALEEDAQPPEADVVGPEVNLPSYANVGYQTETPYCAPLISGVAVPPLSVKCSTSTGEYLPPRQCGKSQCKCSCGKCSNKCSCGKCMK